MITLHDKGAVTAHGHQNFRGYDAVQGKLLSLSPTGRVYTCAQCERRFMTEYGRRVHVCRARTNEAGAAL